MNVLKPFDDCFLSNEDAIRDLEDYEPSIDDIVTVNGIEVIRNDYDAVNAVIPESYDFERLIGADRIKFSEKRVSYLSLSEMGLECLSGEIGRLNKLKQLFLYGNNLSVLPSEIGLLTELKKLYLSDNNLSVLPQELCDLSNLNYFYVHKNPLSDYSILDKLKEKGVEVRL